MRFAIAHPNPLPCSELRILAKRYPGLCFRGRGDNGIARKRSQGFRYEPREERVYINKTQYFEPVPLELWEYQFGGYQVLAKWIKDRRNRGLTLEEIKTYCRVVTAIQRTIALQEEIDALYLEAEKSPVPGTDGLVEMDIT
jgi:hypothetical protein